jgi:hypothetical protein
MIQYGTYFTGLFFSFDMILNQRKYYLETNETSWHLSSNVLNNMAPDQLTISFYVGLLYGTWPRGQRSSHGSS